MPPHRPHTRLAPRACTRGPASPVQVPEATEVVLCSAHSSRVPVCEPDPVEAQHELIGPDQPLPDLLRAFECLENTPESSGGRFGPLSGCVGGHVDASPAGASRVTTRPFRVERQGAR